MKTKQKNYVNMQQKNNQGIVFPSRERNTKQTIFFILKPK